MTPNGEEGGGRERMRMNGRESTRENVPVCSDCPAVGLGGREG